MIEPVNLDNCAKCETKPIIWEIFNKDTGWRIGWQYECQQCKSSTRGRTVRQAARRWNWRQWRARRKMKGEAKI